MSKRVLCTHCPLLYRDMDGDYTCGLRYGISEEEICTGVTSSECRLMKIVTADGEKKPTPLDDTTYIE